MEPTVSDFKADEQVDSLVTLLEMAGVNVDASIVGDWTAGDMSRVAIWANHVIAVADAIETTGEEFEIDHYEIPNCLHGWMETARQIGGTAGCVRELIEDRKHWATLDGDEPEAHTTPPDERTESMARKQFAARFTAVAIQKDHYKLTCTVEKEKLSLDTADDLFARKQLTGSVEVTRDGEENGQGKLIEDGLPTISGVFETKGYRVNNEIFSVGLLFQKDAVDIHQLEGFMGRSGKVKVSKTADVEDPEPGEGGAGDKTVFGDDDGEDD